MSDKQELVAAAQINAFSTPTPGITFVRNFGFETATRASTGVYDLELEHKHDTDKLVVNVTRNSLTSGDIQASLPSEKHIAVNNFAAGVAADSPFFITVWRIRD